MEKLSFANFNYSYLLFCNEKDKFYCLFSSLVKGQLQFRNHKTVLMESTVMCVSLTLNSIQTRN